MMERKKFTIDPVGHNIKFKFDKDSTKEFGGMIVDRSGTGKPPASAKRDKYSKPMKSGQKRPGARSNFSGNKPSVGIPERPVVDKRPVRPKRKMIP